jgi:hypothetical protein
MAAGYVQTLPEAPVPTRAEVSSARGA